MTAERRWQVALIAVGIALLLVALATLLTDVPPARYPGIGWWLVGALIIHDGIAAMAIFGASVLVRRVNRRVPLPIVLIVQGAVVVAVIVTVIVLPEIIKKSIGTANPSILPLDYVANLGLFYGVLAVATALAAGGCLLIARRRRTR